MPDDRFSDPGRTSISWTAIWCGMFTFLAIWTVFEALGMAIFAKTATGVPVPVNVLGLRIWTCILSIIAMFVAGRITGHLAGIANSREGYVHGLIMFGLSVAAILVLGSANGLSAVSTAIGVAYLARLANLGWIGFAGLFLSWLAAMGGSSSAGVGIRRGVTVQTRQAA